MNEESFNEDELSKADLQYQITIKSAALFNIGEKVFLKSNPEVILTVSFIDEEANMLRVRWKEKAGRGRFGYFIPEQILPYCYAGLVIWRDYHLCLN